MIGILKYLVEKVDNIHVQMRNLGRKMGTTRNKGNVKVGNEKRGIKDFLNTTKEIIRNSKNLFQYF